MTDSLIGKLAKAGLDVGGKLRADKTNKEQNYGYISADKILAVGGKALFNQGVAVIPQVIEQETALYEYTDAYGKNKRRYDSRVTFHFTISDGAENLETAWVGMGSDYMTPDKAIYKAITSGHKYFLMKLLSIGEGNEDSEHETDDEPQAKPAQRPTNGKAQQVIVPPPPDELPIIEREAAQPAPLAQPWPNATVAAFAKEFGIQSNHARNALNLSTLSRDCTIDAALEWGQVYKTARKDGSEPPEAAAVANAGIVPEAN